MHLEFEKKKWKGIFVMTCEEQVEEECMRFLLWEGVHLVTVHGLKDVIGSPLSGGEPSRPHGVGGTAGCEM